MSAKRFYPGTKVSTQVQKFLPRYKRFYPGTKVSTQVQKVLPRDKIFYPGQRFIPRYKIKIRACLKRASDRSKASKVLHAVVVVGSAEKMICQLSRSECRRRKSEQIVSERVRSRTGKSRIGFTGQTRCHGFTGP
jgi:hypothetical protein